MKTRIITLGIICLVALANIANMAGQSKIYSNTSIDPVNNVRTITVCEGKADMHLKPEGKYVSQYNEDGTLRQRIIYKWNNDHRDWIPLFKHEYIFSSNKKLENMSYTEWNPKTNSWKEDVHHVIYRYDNDDKPFSIRSEIKSIR